MRRLVGAARVVAVLATAGVALAACGASAEEEAADLCADLRNLDATFELLLVPSDDATVGAVRGALEKVSPFLERLASSDATGEAVDRELDAVEEAFRDGLEGLGDDEPASAAEASLQGDRPRMAAVLAEASSAHACRA